MVSLVSTSAGSPAKIESAGWRDLNDLRHIERLCFPKDMWPLWDLIGILTLPNVLRRKAELEGRMVGFIGVDLRRAQRQAWIATICVHPDYRRMGIASALLAYCEDQTTMPDIRLSVRSSNLPAIHLYRKFGYHNIEIWPAYYQDGEDALVMRKKRAG
jgi:ribosomal-protein-alanine N-acetyltransferase